MVAAASSRLDASDGRAQAGSPNDSKSSLRASHMCAATASLTYASGIIPTAVCACKVVQTTDAQLPVQHTMH